MTEYVAPSPHEFKVNYLFDEFGLRPFFAWDRTLKNHQGHAVESFEYAGEEWTAELTYQESGIQHPGSHTPDGTEFLIEELREYRIQVSAADDPAGQRSFNAHVAPRWQGMEAKSGKEISVPIGFDEGLNVSLSGSNIRFPEYLPLFQNAAEALDVNRRYFAEPHPYSNVQDAEMYVRVHKDESGRIHGREGPIARLGHLLENDRTGYRKVVQNDTDDKGRDLPGYYHTVTLGPERIRRAFEGHRLPKEIKHYYAREAASFDEDEALAHPKLGASYQVSRWDNTLRATPEELAELESELTDTVLSVLADAGIQLLPGESDPFVSEAYFGEDTIDADSVGLHDLDLAELESQQENVVIKHLSDGFSPVEWEALETLVADGGTVSPADIADENERHVGSVRRALNRIPELVEHEWGEVSLRSKHIAELVHDAVREAKEATRRAVEAGAKARAAAERGTDEATSALMAFCANTGMEVDDRSEARLRIRMSKENAKQRIRSAYRLWVRSGRDPARFRSAQVDFGDAGKSDARYYVKGITV